MCWLDSEDYWYLNSLSEQNKQINYYGYVMEVGSEDDTSSIKIMVVELQNVKLVVGFVIPLGLDISGVMEIGFICQEKPDSDIPFSCRISDEVKKLTYTGDDVQKIEYAGLSLEKFYQNKGIKFGLMDLRQISGQNRDRP